MKLQLHFTLLDHNMCLRNSSMCDINATCYNFNGNYRCKCNKGYHGNGMNCSGMELSTIFNLCMKVLPIL